MYRRQFDFEPLSPEIAAMRRSAATTLSTLKIGDTVRYVPPWRGTAEEVEYGKVVEVGDKLVSVGFTGSRSPIPTHPANLSLVTSDKSTG